jgi:hypothetical protein
VAISIGMEDHAVNGRNRAMTALPILAAIAAGVFNREPLARKYYFDFKYLTFLTALNQETLPLTYILFYDILGLYTILNNIILRYYTIHN